MQRFVNFKRIIRQERNSLATSLEPHGYTDQHAIPSLSLLSGANHSSLLETPNGLFKHGKWVNGPPENSPTPCVSPFCSTSLYIQRHIGTPTIFFVSASRAAHCWCFCCFFCCAFRDARILSVCSKLGWRVHGHASVNLRDALYKRCMRVYVCMAKRDSPIAVANAIDAESRRERGAK